MQTAAILSIGDELILGQVGERNAAWIAAELLARGVQPIEHRTVADDAGAIESALAALAARVQLLLVTGGLGPTEDDMTRAAFAQALGVPLEEDARALSALEERARRRGHALSPMNRRQALRPHGTRCIANEHGTAPGIAGTLGGAHVILLPGPPAEMQPMFRSAVVPVLGGSAGADGPASVATECVHSCGLGESSAAARIAHLMPRGANPLVGTTAQGAIVSARIRAWGSAASDGSLAKTADEIERAWAPYAFGRGATTLQEALGGALKSQGSLLASAESCTGGGVGALVTSVPGSSGWFAGGAIVYSNALKHDLCGVPIPVLERHGAVSGETARALACGVAARCGCRWGLGITGIAGPDGGSPTKPVGTVWVGLCDRGQTLDGDAAMARCFLVPGDRQEIRERIGRLALQWLRMTVLGAGDVALLWQLPAQAGAR